MPELPEVETVKNDLAAVIVGRRVQRCQVLDRRVVTGSVPSFIHALQGKIFGSPTRRAKAILIPLIPEQFLVIQLRMTGQFLYQRSSDLSTEVNHVRLVMDLDDGSRLFYIDQRMFGKLSCVSDPMDIPYIAKAGPEPLGDEFTTAYLMDALRSRKGPIKTVLLNQDIVAGLGNIYVSEALFAAGIHPATPGKAISRADAVRLRARIREILNEAIAHRGTSMRNYRDASGQKGGFMDLIKVYGRAGESCPRCAGAIERMVQAGRSTFFCPSCQPMK